MLSSPHSGQCYPPSVLAQSRLAPDSCGRWTTARSTSCSRAAAPPGATLIAATYPRAVVDLNRDPLRAGPGLAGRPGRRSPGLRATVKARAGLGVVPTRLLGEPIYAARLSAAELRRRIEPPTGPTMRSWRRSRPSAGGASGASLVLDCHSMPTLPAPARGERADRRGAGRPLRPELPSAADRGRRAPAGRGRPAGRAQPPLRRRAHHRAHGRPAQGSHALQLELRRSLFMDERSHAPHDRASRALQALLGELVEALAAAVLALPTGRGVPTRLRRHRALKVGLTAPGQDPPVADRDGSGVRFGVLVAASVLGLARRLRPRRAPPTRTLCARAIARSEAAAPCRRGLLTAVAVSESGRYDRGRRAGRALALDRQQCRRRPLLRHQGGGDRPCRAAAAAGERNIDVGCMQINLMHHPDAFASLEEAFEPVAQRRLRRALPGRAASGRRLLGRGRSSATTPPTRSAAAPTASGSTDAGREAPRASRTCSRPTGDRASCRERACRRPAGPTRPRRAGLARAAPAASRSRAAASSASAGSAERVAVLRPLGRPAAQADRAAAATRSASAWSG